MWILFLNQGICLDLNGETSLCFITCYIVEKEMAGPLQK